jgi:hypothetical protein
MFVCMFVTSHGLTYVFALRGSKKYCVFLSYSLKLQILDLQGSSRKKIQKMSLLM